MFSSSSQAFRGVMRVWSVKSSCTGVIETRRLWIAWRSVSPSEVNLGALSADPVVRSSTPIQSCDGVYTVIPSVLPRYLDAFNLREPTIRHVDVEQDMAWHSLLNHLLGDATRNRPRRFVVEVRLFPRAPLRRGTPQSTAPLRAFLSSPLQPCPKSGCQPQDSAPG